MTTRHRLLLIATAALLALWSVAQYRAWGSEQVRLALMLETAQVAERLPDLGDRVHRANTPLRARMRATRPLVAYYLNPTWLFDVEDSERAAAWQRSVATLETIRDLSADAMAREPSSWEASMLFGATTYLLQPRGNLAVSMSDLESWEVPLQRAASLQPEYVEPARYLTVAYVQHWQSLSSGQREQARETLAFAFTDKRTFDMVIELWLRLVPDRREALALVPDTPEAWRRLERIFQRKREWPMYEQAHARLLKAEDNRITTVLDEGEARVAGGDYRRGTNRFHSVAGSLEPDTRNLHHMERILDRMPAGPVPEPVGRNLRMWLEWALDLGFLRAPPLTPERFTRLAGMVDDARLDERATAALMAGDLVEAERLERRRQGPFDARWGPYLILRAEALLDRGLVDDARLSLLRVGDAWQDHPTYLRVLEAIAEARNDPQALAAVEAARERLPATSWTGGRMTWDRSRARLELVPERSAYGLAIGFFELPSSGRLFKVRWNGGVVATYVARPDEPILVEVEVAREPSLLELQAVDGRPFVPGRIALLDSRPG